MTGTPEERDHLILEMMKRGRPVRSIAANISLDADYCGKICRKLARLHGIDYKPDIVRKRSGMDLGLTDASRTTRRRLGNLLAKLGPTPKVGMTQRAAKYALERPFQHDWKLSEIERLAQELGRPFAEIMQEIAR